ncbi:MAG: PQQ-binding-like beta-propeller repeat protein [Pirellulales bacterium]
MTNDERRITNSRFFSPVYRKRGAGVNGGFVFTLNCLLAGFLDSVRRPIAVLVAAIAILASFNAVAGDWPQILGPNRNGIAVGEKLLERWPKAGPKVEWRIPVGRGFAGVAVAAGKVVVFDRQADSEVVTVRDARTGEELWSVKAPVRYESTIAPDDGPRCVPLVRDGRVYVLGVAGRLRCLALADGKEHWQRELLKDFDVPPSYFGVGNTPLLVGDKLLVNVGGRDGAGIVAFNMGDGTTAWKATDEGASYSSPTVAMVDGRQLAVFVTRLAVVGLEPASGNLRFRFPFGQRGPTVNAASPLVIDGHLFVSASYGVGAVWAKLSPDSAKELWRSDEVMSSQYATCVYQDGALFGIDGRQDQPPGRLRSFDPRSRRIFWTEENFGTGNLILAGDKLLILKTDGELILAAADKSRYRSLARAQILDGTAQPLPALANGLLYVRDENTLKCLRVGE